MVESSNHGLPPVADYRPGLSGRTSVGCCGRYRPFASVQQFRLATAIWKDGIFRQPGAAGKTHFQLDLPESYAVTARSQNWTGRTLSYTWGDNEGLDLHLRSTLAGARIVAHGRSMHIRWGDNLPDGLKAIDSGGADFGLISQGRDLSRYRFLVGQCRLSPVLMVLSAPLDKIVVTAHGHWEFQFAEPGAAMFIVPLLDKTQLSLILSMQDVWLSLLNHPPSSCEEFYAVRDDFLHIEARFPGAEYSPIPSMIAQTNSMRGLLYLSEERVTLLDSFMGPISLVKGDRWHAKIDLRWTRATTRANQPVSGLLSPVPEELVYPGDWSFDPQTQPMDKLLALRTWAPILKDFPENLKLKLISQLIPPTPSDFKKSLHTIVEPVSGIEWSKDSSLFENKGDCSWDPDWYNGLSLSGLERAIECGEKQIAGPALALARECKPERDRMLKYFELFHDWSLWAAWTDARGLFWLPDCCHNGMEGLLAEARLRRSEGDAATADAALYLAGKTAVCLMSLFTLPNWCERTGFMLPAVETSGFLKPGEAGAEAFGVNAIVDTDGIATVTRETKNPYCLAGHFPEYSALLKLHAPLQRLNRLAELWTQNHPERYNDWIAFYIGTDPKQIAARKANLEQEAKDQAAVFYHLAPEVCLRLWVLDEPPVEIESRFATPLNLAEQVLLRSSTLLEIPDRSRS